MNPKVFLPSLSPIGSKLNAEPKEQRSGGGRLDEVQSLVYWWLLDPAEACEIVGYPIQRYTPWNSDRSEPPYLPCPSEIERLSQRMRSG